MLVKPEGLYINHPDRSIRRAHGGLLLRPGGFLRRPRRQSDGGRLAETAQRAAGRFPRAGLGLGGGQPSGTLSRRAEQREVTICFEPLAPAETNFINTAAEALQFVQQVPSPHFKIILDVKAMCSESKPIPQIIRESWPHFAHFHANDRNLKGPGFGDVDFKPIAAALKEVGYQGFVSVEVFNFDEGAEAIASRSLEYLKRVFA